MIEEGGATFCVHSARAAAVELCLFSESGEETRRPLERHGDLWRVRVEGVVPGQLYGYRVEGPYAPSEGHRFNPSKLLLDPAAAAVHGDLRWHPSIFGYGAAGPYGRERSPADSAPVVPRSVVVDGSPVPQEGRRPSTPWSRSVVYEAHVRGMTRRLSRVPEPLRGTYLGLVEPPVLEHLLSLGVTAIQLLPVQHSASEVHLARSGATNYWGYSPLAWFAPHAGYATGSRGEQVGEFRSMVAALHEAGIEVLLDVVFNHTVEGGEHGPTLSLRGLDNECYYRHHDGDPSRALDFTGCGNTLDFSREAVVELVVACLRYWVEEMQVDGFRFDLGVVLGRDPEAFRPDALFFERVASEPALRSVKLIAEPWDLGPGGYALGEFPSGWAQWNDRFRDAARGSWCQGGVDSAELSRRVSGSADLFAAGEGPSLDFVTCHDGFTLADLVSYRHKINWANGEDNRDGSTHDLGTDCGVEGPSTDEAVLACRSRTRRNLLATLAITRGVPMLSHGDELGRTQGGNNNAYCQDNLTSWLHWSLDDAGEALLAYVQRLFRVRRQFVAEVADAAPEALSPFREDGPCDEAVALLYPGCEPGSPTWLVVLNPSEGNCGVVLPVLPGALGWRCLIDTESAEWPEASLIEPEGGSALRVAARSVAVLRSESG